MGGCGYAGVQPDQQAVPGEEGACPQPHLGGGCQQRERQGGERCV